MRYTILNKLIFTIFAVFIAADLMAQVPQGFNFQAVARDSEGLPISEQQVGLEVNIVKGSEAGEVVYTETHVITTSSTGLIQIVIGEGTAAGSAIFTEIDWSNDNYYVNLGIDTQGGTNYEDLGTTRLLSVPYALLAGNVVSGNFDETNQLITIDPNDPAYQDSLKIVRLGSESETEFAYGVQIEGKSTGGNRPLVSRIKESDSNIASQYAITGASNGMGTGTHIGVLGSAFNRDAVGGGTRYGIYGQAASQSKFNYGGFTYSTGAGNGQEVPFGQTDSDGLFGTFNIGYGSYVSGNTNGNVGVDLTVAGNQGSRINIGAEFRVRTTASGHNSGVQTFVNGSSSLNRGFFAEVTGNNKNEGMHLNVQGGTSNIGLIVYAATAAELNGNVVVDGDLSATTVTQTSDQRYKKNIKSLNNALNNTLNLRGVSYYWIDEEKPAERQIGVIAQEVEEIYPEFVHTNENGKKSVNYAQITAILIEAVKELNGKIEILESQNQELQTEVEVLTELGQRIVRIEKLLKQSESVKSQETISKDK